MKHPVFSKNFRSGDRTARANIEKLAEFPLYVQTNFKRTKRADNLVTVSTYYETCILKPRI